MKPITTIIAALFFGSALFAEETKSSYSISTDFTFATEYIFRGIEQQDRAFQPSITLAYDALTLGIWSSQALNHKRESWAQGSEIDFTAAYAIPVTKDTTLTFGGTYYYYPSARPSLGEPDGTYEPSVGISGPLGPLAASATYYHDFVLRANTVLFTVAHGFALAGDKGSFDVSAFYGSNDITDGNGDLPGTGGVDYRFFGADAVLSYKASATTTAKVGAHYVDVSRLAGAPGANIWFSVGVTVGL